MHHPQLLIFDFDGTLIDSVGDLRAALNVLLTELGQPPLVEADVRPMIGDGVGKLVERALAARPGVSVEPAAATARFLEIYEAAPASLTQPYLGVADTLAALVGRGIKLALCTNKPERVSLRVLQALGLEHYFSKIIGGDTLPWRKPDPRIIEVLLDAFDLSPENALYVGDSEVDAALASAAGVSFVLMTYGYCRGSVEAIACKAALDHFPDLMSLI